MPQAPVTPPRRRTRAVGSVLLAAVALCVTAAAASAQQPVLDAAARRLLDPVMQQELVPLARPLPGLLEPAVPLAARYSLYRAAAGVLMVGLIVEVAEPAALGQLRALGAEVGSVIGDIATVRVPLSQLEALEALPLIRAQAARMLAAVHDSSMRAVRADAVRQHAGGQWVGRTGRGVIVGVIDTGLDVRHADFRDDAGATRVLGVWDQTTGGRPPTGFGYGFHCTTAAVQRAIDAGDASACPVRDLAGHGTHVTGTAAGNGATRAGRELAGVAPEADLLIVRAGDGLFPEDRVLDALHWLRAEAERQGRPAVVNVSLGHHFGPHDGSLLFERALDALAGPGFIVVVSAGNAGANETAGPSGPRRLIHARVTPAAGVARTVEFDISPYTPSGSCLANSVALSVWYDARDRITVTVMRPNGSGVTALAGASPRVESNSDGRVVVENAFPLPAGNATAEAYIQVDGCAGSGPPASGRWQIRLQAQPTGATSGTPADVYMHSVQFGGGGTAYGTTGFDNRFTVGAPGTARRAITVGAFATRGCWPDSTGTRCYDQREAIGDLARFSSAGPTRDGRQKPDLTAPGIGVVSALSRHANAPPTRIAPGGAYWTLEGTSMAAPHVSGAIALLLQELPSLTPEHALAVLAGGARNDAFTSLTYDLGATDPRDWWGAGKLDVAAALEGIAPTSVVATVSATPRADTLVQGALRQLQALTRDARGDVVFAAVSWRSLSPGVATVDFAGRARGIQPGSAAIVATAGTAADTVHLVVEPPAVLIVTGQSLAGEMPVVGARNALLPLLALRLRADGREAVRVRSLSVELNGKDDDVRVLVLRGTFTGAVVPDSADIIGSARIALQSARVVVLTLDSVIVPPNAERDLSIVLQLSGAAAHGTSFSARLLPDRTRTTNLESGAVDLIAQPLPIATETATTLLRAGELFTLSENPVRGASVHLHFAEQPTEAAIHTITGGRVIDLMPHLNGLSWTWDLTNDRGSRVAPGVYLILVRAGGQLIREKVMVLARPHGGQP